MNIIKIYKSHVALSAVSADFTFCQQHTRRNLSEGG